MSSGKKQPRSEGKFNFSHINEIRSAVVVETFNMIAGRDLTVEKQAKECLALYHGEKGIMGQAEKFMKRMAVYSQLWHEDQTKYGNRFVISERLHQQAGKALVAGDNITEALIRQQYATQPENQLSGTTIVSRAKDVVKEAKKMHTLLRVAVRERVLDKAENGEYTFPSGKSEDDFDHWMIKKMYNWDLLFGPSGKASANKKSSGAQEGQKSAGDTSPTEDDEAEEEVVEEEVTNNDDDDASMSSGTIPPRDIFPSTSDDSDEEVEGLEADPPNNWLPKGWVVFKTRGPMSLPIEDRLDFFSGQWSETGKKSTTNDGRAQARKDDVAARTAQREYAFNDLTGSKAISDLRGVGADTRKFVVLHAQKNAQLSIQEYEADVMKFNMASKSRSGQRDANLEIAKIFKDLGDIDEVKAAVASAREDMAAINKIDTQLMELRNKGADGGTSPTNREQSTSPTTTEQS